jgi:cathepsin D
MWRGAGVELQGSPLDISSDSVSLAAIDTGTTLIGGPVQIVRQLYASIPGSMPGTGDYTGYYFFRTPHALLSRSI